MSGYPRRFLLPALLLPLLPLQAMAEGHGGAESGPPKPTFLPLGDFTLNLPDDGGSGPGYVVISITIEAVPAAANDLKVLMPRLKENVMRRLMSMADRGALQPGHTDPLVVKATLMDSVSKVRADSVLDVLITRLLYG